MKYKHWRYQGGLLMVSYIGMYTRNQKIIKRRMETTIGLYGEGNWIIYWHSFCVGSCFSWTIIVVACIVIIEAHCTKSIWVKSVMTTSARVQKKSLMMTISIRLSVWRRKKWETFFCTWGSLSNVITTMVSWSISWVVVRSLPHKQRSK